jgi:hypothetical protein
MINFYIDTDAIGEIAGFVKGVEDAFTDSNYLDGLAAEAHAQASESFDRAAAATAHAGYLSHVYEYGTAGITPGPAKFGDPTSPMARLYTHKVAGSGGDYDALFFFRPAVAANPPKTTRDTGVRSAYLKKLSRRKYVFRQRARLMEYGGEVNIKPKRGKYLFVPAPNDPKGFVLWDAELHGRGINMTLGENTAGTFTSFWEAWWGTEGQAIIDKVVERRVSKDVAEEFKKMQARAARPDPKPPTVATAEMRQASIKGEKTVYRGIVASAARFVGRFRR